LRDRSRLADARIHASKSNARARLADRSAIHGAAGIEPAIPLRS